MLAINKILSCFELKPLSLLETLDNSKGISLSLLEQKGQKLYSYVLSLIFFPKVIIYKKDIATIEHIFELCGDVVLSSYMNLLRYYSGNVRLDDNTIMNLSVSIAIDFSPVTMSMKEKPITGMCTVEGEEIRLRTIMLPLSALSNGSIVRYSNNPSTLLQDLLTRGSISLTGIESNSEDILHRFKLYIIDEQDTTRNFYVLKGYPVGLCFCFMDLLVIIVNDRCYSCYIRKDILYEDSFSLREIINKDYITQLLYQYIFYNDRGVSLSEFIGSCKGYIKTFSDVDFDRLVQDREFGIKTFNLRKKIIFNNL